MHVCVCVCVCVCVRVAFANGGLSELDGLHKVCLNQRVFVSVRACMFLHAHTHTHTHTHTHAHAATPSHAHTPSLRLCPSPGPAAVLQAVHSDRVGDWRVRFGVAPAEL